MSINVMNLVWYTKGLSASQKTVLLALADHANNNGESVYPSVKRLTVKTSLSERAVIYALGALRKGNFISITNGSRAHSPTEYSINIDFLAKNQHDLIFINNLAVQEMHPSKSNGARDASLEVQEVHPSKSRGARDASLEVQEMHDRGARGAPKSSLTINSNQREENIINNISGYGEDLKQAFVLASGRQWENNHDWELAISEMLEAGITREVILKAVEILQKGAYKITGPKSIVFTAKNLMKKRSSSIMPANDDHLRYVKGEYGKFGEY